MHQRQRGRFDALALLAHTAAVVDNQPHGNGNVFALEILDLLRDAVFEDLEGALRKIRYQVAALVGNRDIERNQAGLGGKDGVAPDSVRRPGFAAAVPKDK